MFFLLRRVRTDRNQTEFEVVDSRGHKLSLARKPQQSSANLKTRLPRGEGHMPGGVVTWQMYQTYHRVTEFKLR